MGTIDFLRRLNPFAPERKSSSLASPGDALLELLGATPSAANVVVNTRTAVGCMPFRCGMQAICEPLGQLPVHVHARNADGSKERAPDHPAYRLLHDEANDWTSASDFREQLTRDVILQGNGYAFINRVDGKPIELLRLAPEVMDVTVDATSGEPVYKNKNKNKNTGRRFDRNDIFHIRAPGCDGIKGDSFVTVGREPIGTAIALDQHAARLFGNSARPSGVVSIKGNFNADAIGKMKAAWDLAFKGEKQGATAILPEGEYTPITLTSTDAQFLENRNFAIAEIARLFRVPPIFLMDYGRATWSNSEEMGRQFLTFTLMPWIKRWESEIRLKLFTPEDRKKYVAEFLVDDLLRADFAQRMDGYGKAIAARIMNPNEARAAENRPAYAGGERFENPNTSTTTANNGPSGT